MKRFSLFLVLLMACFQMVKARQRNYDITNDISSNNPSIDIQTFIIDGSSQPPLVGAEIKGIDDNLILSRGFILSNDQESIQEDPESILQCDDNDHILGPISSYGRFDCSEYTGKQFSAKLRYLKSSTTYYVRSYLTTSTETKFGNVVSFTSQTFNRSSSNPGYANVWHAFSYNLFDLVSDEIIDPSTEGFYYSTNENPTLCRYQLGTSYNTCYKYKSQLNYKYWYYKYYSVTSHRLLTPLPTMTLLENGKMALASQDGATIYYSINGDGFRPELFTDVYLEPLTVSINDVVYCYAIDDENVPSMVNVYKVLDFEDGTYSTCSLVDGTPYSNPTAFDVNTFTYTRTFNNKNWQVLYLPVALDYNDWKDDFDMAEMWAVHVYDDDQDGVVDRNEMELVPVKTSTEANKVFFIRAKSTGTKVITKTNCTVEATVENTVDCSNTHYKFVITGNYDFVSGQTMFDNLYYAPVGGNWKRAENNVNALNPFRAYMQVLDRSNNAPVALAPTIHINLWDEEEENASALDNIKENQETEVIVESMHIGLRPGRYTINGRKIVVK